MIGRITQLFIYPVKSLAGIAVDQVEVTAKGLARDREWMLVDASGRFVTQRQLPQMATISVELLPDGLRLGHPRAGVLDVSDPPADAPQVPVVIWHDQCQVQAAGDGVDQWLAEALATDKPVHLVKFAPGFIREGKPERFGDATTHLADAAPFLVANSASLNALNQKLCAAGLPSVDMRHFRPNLVADGLPAFVEHQKTVLATEDGAMQWALCDHCQRCSIITVDPDSGERLAKAVPFKQLAELNPMPDNPKAPAFGVNARLICGDGLRINVGSDVIWT